jgi:uncharacterized protein (TIGR02145 family)
VLSLKITLNTLKTKGRKFGLVLIHSILFLVCKNWEEEMRFLILTNNTIIMKSTKIILLTMLISFGFNTMAQVAINTDGSEPDGSAMLDVKSISKGLLLPRLNTIQISYIANPTAGLLVFNVDSSDFYGFNGSKWIALWDTSDTIDVWSCGTPIADSRDGQSYNTIQIGSQCWMAENLNIGTMINATTGGANSDGEQTNNNIIEKYCQDNDETNCITYGGLYKWDEMMQYVTIEEAQGICPSGWHLSTDGEWALLSDFLGGQSIAGGKMKEIGTTHWDSPNTGSTNSSGFTGLPGSFCDSYGFFISLGVHGGYWWSSSEGSDAHAWHRFLLYNSGQVFRNLDYKPFGFSVRCLKD